MTATNHAITGALIAMAIKQPALALPAAFFSHFVLDMIPHWSHKFKNHYYTQISVVVDLLLAAVLSFMLAFSVNKSSLVILAAAFLAALPDIIWISEFSKPRDFSLKGKTLWSRAQWFFHKIQWSETSAGFYIELAWGLAVIWLSFKYY